MVSNLFTKIDTIFILYNIYIEIERTWSGKKETKKIARAVAAAGSMTAFSESLEDKSKRPKIQESP